MSVDFRRQTHTQSCCEQRRFNGFISSPAAPSRAAHAAAAAAEWRQLSRDALNHFRWRRDSPSKSRAELNYNLAPIGGAIVRRAREPK